MHFLCIFRIGFKPCESIKNSAIGFETQFLNNELLYFVRTLYMLLQDSQYTVSDQTDFLSLLINGEKDARVN